LTHRIRAPLRNGRAAVALSDICMWPGKNEGEEARLYEAVTAVSDFAIALGINVPTGKDSLSMKQRYKDTEVIAPGTVIISAAAHCNDINKVVEPVLQKNGGDIYYINLSKDSHKLGGSSFAQICNRIGNEAPTVVDPQNFKDTFNTLQGLIVNGNILAGHDVASGGLITTLLEMCFADHDLGADLDLTPIGESDTIKLLFSENAGIVFQASDASVEKTLAAAGIQFSRVGSVTTSPTLGIKNHSVEMGLNVNSLRDTWYKTSYLLDQKQTANNLAKDRFDNFKNQPLKYIFPKNFDGKFPA